MRPIDRPSASVTQRLRLLRALEKLLNVHTAIDLIAFADHHSSHPRKVGTGPRTAAGNRRARWRPHSFFVSKDEKSFLQLSQIILISAAY